MRIAVCDDENAWINYMEKFIERISKIYKDTEYDVFYSGEQLLEKYKSSGNIYDIVILDIEMGGENGLTVANTIRELDNSVIIFFITSHSEYVFECFFPQPMNVWRKPVEYELFESDICRAYVKINEDAGCLRITENRRKVRIKCEEILYVESIERKSWIHTVHSKYSSNQKLSDIERQLDKRMFARTYKSFFVNLKYIHIIEDNELTLYNTNAKIPISRTYKKSLDDAYINFEERKLMANEHLHRS